VPFFLVALDAPYAFVFATGMGPLLMSRHLTIECHRDFVLLSLVRALICTSQNFWMHISARPSLLLFTPHSSTVPPRCSLCSHPRRDSTASIPFEQRKHQIVKATCRIPDSISCLCHCAGESVGKSQPLNVFAPSALCAAFAWPFSVRKVKTPNAMYT
jgi:hypothetical protein